MFARQANPKRAGFGITLIAVWLIAQTLTSIKGNAAPPAGSPGSVRLVIRTNSGSDPFTGNPTAANEQWMASHFWRMVVFTTYWDSKLSWYPNGLFYKDAYAIYVSDATTISAHPDWILKDGSGKFLYINYACSGGTCPQYAADVSNAGFRKWWTDSASNTLAKGYKGIFIDDVNMDWRISNGSGTSVIPVDPNNGQPMMLENWRLYMAQFLEQIRGAFPSAEIGHNSIWYANNTSADANIARQIQAADYQNVEHGFADGEITGGSGTFSLSNLLNHADYVHSLGKGLTFSGVPADAAGKEYVIANYLLVSNGFDSVGSSGGNDFWPTWWPGYDVKLGEPTGLRYKWNGLWRRDFTSGMTLVNEPGAASATVTLPGTYQRTDGSVVKSITLAAKQGAMLVTSSGQPGGSSGAPNAPSGLTARSTESIAKTRNEGVRAVLGNRPTFSGAVL